MKTLAGCIATVESSNNLDAIKFERRLFDNTPPWILDQVPTIQKYNKCDETTAIAIGCTSYGEYQLLGANVYAKGADTSIISWCYLVSEQEAIFEAFIKTKGYEPYEDITLWNDQKFIDFATFYNGPDDVENYVKAMKATIPNGTE
jgi:hypothetical protein